MNYRELDTPALLIDREILMENLLTGSCQSGDRSSMEGVYQGDDFITCGAFCFRSVFSRKLDSAFIGLCSGISQKHPAESGGFA